MTSKITPNIWHLKFSQFGSHIYLIKLKDKNILIDTSSKANRKELIEKLKELKLKSSDIDFVILTHSHFDHIGNTPIFKNAKIYGNKKGFKTKNILDIKDLEIKEFKIIETPGHSSDGICVLYGNVLFSGDTIFNRGTVGRTDLPTSSQEQMKQSLGKLKKLNFTIIAPGHGKE